MTPEQIFWFDALLKMKAKALKEKAKSTKPITAMTVYPPNTPAKLVPKVLLIKSQVQVNIYSLVQLFSEFDKTCKKRITPTGLTKGERVLNKQRHVISPRFSDMHDAYTVAQKRIAELEAENSNLTQKIQKDDHDEMIKHFSKLEVEHLNLKLKYQHLKERFGNKISVTSSDAPAFESVFEIGNLKEQLQGRGNTIRELKAKISRLQKKHSEADPILDFKALDSHNKDLNAKVNALHDLNERFRVENKKVKQHYKELYDSIKLMRAKTIKKTTSLLNEIETLKAQIKGKTNCVTMLDPVKPKVLAPGMYAIDVEPILPRNRNNREVHLEYLKHLKESIGTLREIVKEAREKNYHFLILLVRYRRGQLNDSTWGQSYAEWPQNVNESVKKALLKSWVIDCFKEALDPDKDLRGRSFNDYKWVFDLEIEQLADEYELGIGKKGHMLEMIWENCKNIQCKAKEWWFQQLGGNSRDHLQA
ncbi:hypothetical protein Tco_1293988 [Tanacetum coccineum]